MRIMVPMGYKRGQLRASSLSYSYDEWFSDVTYNGTTIIDIADDMNLWSAVSTVFEWNSKSSAYYARTFLEGKFGASTGQDPRTRPAGDPWDFQATLDYSTLPEKWWAFDGTVRQATGSGDLTYQMVIGETINCMCFTGLQDATSVNVTMTDGVTEVYNQTKTLTSTDFPGVQLSLAAFTDLPDYPDATIDITVAGTAPKLARVLWGYAIEIGFAKESLEVGYANYASYTDGVLSSNAPRANVSGVIVVPVENVEMVRELMASNGLVPIVAIGRDSGGNGTFAYGFTRSFEVSVRMGVHAICSFALSGVDEALQSS